MLIRSSVAWIAISTRLKRGKTPLIAGRISQVADIIPEGADFFILNSDAIFEFDISASYLLTKDNSSNEEIIRFVEHFKDAGCDLLRFAFPQLPRGDEPDMNVSIPSEEECRHYEKNYIL